MMGWAGFLTTYLSIKPQRQGTIRSAKHNVGALTIRIEFWGILHHNYNKVLGTPKTLFYLLRPLH